MLMRQTWHLRKESVLFMFSTPVPSQLRLGWSDHFGSFSMLFLRFPRPIRIPWSICSNRMLGPDPSSGWRDENLQLSHPPECCCRCCWPMYHTLGWRSLPKQLVSNYGHKTALCQRPSESHHWAEEKQFWKWWVQVVLPNSEPWKTRRLQGFHAWTPRHVSTVLGTHLS